MGARGRDRVCEGEGAQHHQLVHRPARMRSSAAKGARPWCGLVTERLVPQPFGLDAVTDGMALAVS